MLKRWLAAIDCLTEVEISRKYIELQVKKDYTAAHATVEYPVIYIHTTKICIMTIVKSVTYLTDTYVDTDILSKCDE